MINEKILAIIPARGGSKRVPKKNIKSLFGKPLIYYSINSALQSQYIDKVIVSTEDEEIKDISIQFGAEIVERPNNLAEDESSTIDVVFHVLDMLKENSYEPTLIILIQPTSPLRDNEDIDEAIELFLKSKCDILMSVCETQHPPFWCLKLEEGFLKPIFDNKYLSMRSQDLEKAYQPNGAIFITRPKDLTINKSFYSENAIPYIMPLEKSVDIDDEFDFMIAEFLMQRHQKKNN
jgi:CMP-N,N'-diacetyllegionaminic acid synthase